MTITIVPMTTKLGKLVTNLEGLLTIKLFSALISHVTNKINYIFPAGVPMATKLGRMKTYLDAILSIKSLAPFHM